MLPVDSSVLNTAALLFEGEWFFVIVFLFLIVVAPIWALIRTFKLKRHSARREELSQLIGRMYGLEKKVEELTKAVEGSGVAAPATEIRPAPTKPAAIPTAPPKPAEVPAAPSVPPPEILPATRPTTPPVVSVPAPVPASPPQEVQAAASAGLPKFETAPPTPRKSWADLEERFGTNWLNKIGIAALVFGAAFFVNYAMKELGPAGKITLLYFLAAILLGLGIFGERKERYRVPAQAMIGGGWALAYLTTYALHNIPAVRIVESPVAGFLLLFVVAVGMVAHSLRYNSQVVTGLAYMLAFASVAVRFIETDGEAGRIGAGSLVASAVLAVSFVVVLARRKWYEIEPFAIVAVYGVHWLWLRLVRDWYGAHKEFPDFAASVALCTVYWAAFTVSHFLRDEREPGKRNSLIASFLANAAGYLLVLRYQSIHPEWRFWFLLSAGAMYMALAVYSRRLDRRLGFLLHSTLGATLLLIAIPYRYSDARLELIWLVEAEALLFVGWKLAEPHFRKLGWAGLGIVATYVTFNDLSPRLAAARGEDFPLGILLVVIAAVYFANARLAPRLLGEQATETDISLAKVSTPVASAFLLAASWVALHTQNRMSGESSLFMWTGLAWAVTAVALLETGRRIQDPVLRACGHGAALLAALRLLTTNFHFAQPAFGTNLRLVTVTAGAALLYFASRRVLAPHGAEGEQNGLRAFVARHGGLRAAYTWSASFLVTMLLWYEVTSAALALAWGLSGLFVLEIGRWRKEKPLLLQAHTLFALSFARIFFADLNAEASMGPLTERTLSVTLLALLFYYAAATSPDEWRRMRAALYWFGTTALVALARFELPLDWVAVGWAAMTVALYFAGRKLQLRVLRHQAYLLTLGVALRCAFDNFYQKSELWTGLNVRTVTVTLASLILYALLAAALLRRAPTPAATEAADD